MSGPGRSLHVTLDLLDRQLIDRNGVLCGNVDDLELTRSEATGEWYVTAILSGSGALAHRLGRRRFGAWLHRLDERMHDDRAEHGRVPIDLAVRVGPAIELAVDAADLSTHDLERWAAIHVTGHIPGSDARARQ